MRTALGDFSKRVELEKGSHSVAISVYSRSDAPRVEKAGLVSYVFRDENNEPVEPKGTYSNSSKVGPYFYLRAGEEGESTVTRVSLPIPDQAVLCDLKGHAWKPDTVIYLPKEPLIQQPGSDLDSVFDEEEGQTIPMAVADFVRAYDVIKDANALFIHTAVRADEAGVVSKALLLVQFLGRNGEVLLPAGELPMNPVLGAFIYLGSAAGEATTRKISRIDVPGECRQVRLYGRDWAGKPLALVEPVQVSYAFGETDPEGALATFLQSVPEDANLIVIYTTSGGIGGESLPSRSSRLAIEFAEAGNWVVFFPNCPLDKGESATPYDRIHQIEHRYFRAFMDIAMKRRGKTNKFICSSFPDLSIAASIDRMRDNSWTVVYELRDDVDEYNRIEYSKWFNPLLEARVAKRADKIVAVSAGLCDKAGAISGRTDVVLIPNAIDDEFVKQSAYLRQPESLEIRRNSRVVGYIGQLAHSWFDWNLLIGVAQRVPSIDFEVIGHDFPTGLVLPANIAHLGEKPYTDCLPIVERWRVGVIPFISSSTTYGVDSMVYDYLAMGLRVVGAPMDSLKDAPGSWVYRDVDGAVAGICNAIDRDMTIGELGEYDEYLSHSQWSDRARQMLEVLEGKKI